MLAGDLVPQLAAAGVELELVDVRRGQRAGRTINALDITDEKAAKKAIQSAKPNWIVNCAAYTQVDNAEKEYDAAFNVNAAAVGSLARIAREARIPMMHISTDYVFGGAKAGSEHRSPIAEDAPLSPCGIYGQSKRFGEDLLQSILPEQHLLVRTSWLHGIHGPNFIDTMLRLAGEKTSLKVVNDQHGSPTWTGWLASTLVKLLAKNARGVYHASSRGNITWFDFAKEIFHQAQLPMEILPQTSAELNRPAPRPPYSVLDVTKIERALGEVCISWQECIAQHLAARAAAEE